jgi:hypothetical protein
MHNKFIKPAGSMEMSFGNMNDHKASVIFGHLLPEKYAIRVFHKENENNVPDGRFIEMPHRT